MPQERTKSTWANLLLLWLIFIFPSLPLCLAHPFTASSLITLAFFSFNFALSLSLSSSVFAVNSLHPLSLHSLCQAHSLFCTHSLSHFFSISFCIFLHCVSVYFSCQFVSSYTSFSHSQPGFSLSVSFSLSLFLHCTRIHLPPLNMRCVLRESTNGGCYSNCRQVYDP